MWEKYRFGTGFSEPFVIHFPDYSKGMYQRLCGRNTGLVPASQSPSSYTSQTTVKVCIRDCVGEIQEWYRLLRALVIHFPDYSKGMYQRLCGRNTGLVPASQSPSSYTSRTTVKVCIRDCVGEVQVWYRLLRALRHTLPGLQ